MNWHVFMVHGNFTEPTMGKNFIVIRIPKKGVPWRKMLSAIRRVVKPWFSKGEKSYWDIDGDPGNLWETKVTVKYEWNGSCLVRAEG